VKCCCRAVLGHSKLKGIKVLKSPPFFKATPPSITEYYPGKKIPYPTWRQSSFESFAVSDAESMQFQ